MIANWGTYDNLVKQIPRLRGHKFFPLAKAVTATYNPAYEKDDYDNSD